MQEVLTRAHQHKGTAFVEILQNCPVFNDGVWEEMQDRKTRTNSTIALEQGEPLVFGTPDARKGIVLNNGVPAVIDLAAGEDPVARGVIVHDEQAATSAYAGMLATLQRPDYPLPVGVFRSVEKTTYEDMLQAQVDQAIAQRGRGDLRALLHSGDTWQI